MTIVLITIAVLIIGLYVMVLAVLTVRQRRFLYGPDTNRPDLAAAGVPGAREMSVRTADGLDLLAWFVPPGDEALPVVLYLHGNGGHIGYRANRMAQLQRFGWGALLLDYRGYGGNPGSPTESGLIDDARAAYAVLRDLGIDGSRLLLWGESLGTGVAVRLATEVDIGALMLESPYTSILAIARQRFPYAPVGWLLRDRFDLIGRVPSVGAPVLVMTGGRDEVVSPAMGRAVFEAAQQPKVFWLAPDAGHNDLVEAGAFDTVRDFIEAHWVPSP